MENKKSTLATVLLLIAVLVIGALAGYIYMQKIETDKKIADLENEKSQIQTKLDESQGKIDGVSNIINSDKSNSEENIILYEGKKIEKKTGIQYLADDIKKVVITQKDNVTERKDEILIEIPGKIQSDLGHSSGVSGKKVDLDGDGIEEYIIIDDKIGSSDNNGTTDKNERVSKVMLYDSKFDKIANLVTFADNFMDEEFVYIDLDMIEFFDIDNDGIMEVIIEIPAYEGSRIGIWKYNNNKVEGETDIKADLNP